MARTPDRTPPVPLPPMRPEQARRLLSPPWIPTMLAPAVARACRARPLAVPVHLVLPAPALATRVVRALHGLGGPHGELLLAGPTAELCTLPLGATLACDPTALDDAAQAALEALLDDGDVWVVAITDEAAVLPPALAERFAAIVVDVPPLARRQLELPALSAAILQTLAQRAGRPAPGLTPAARTRLATSPWPGDVLELEACLGRALAATDGDTIDVPHLGLASPAAPGPDAREAAATPGPAAAPAAAPVPPDARLEALLAELAHEILNPLSTVKMLLGHLPQLLADAEAREGLSGRADEAIERVDHLLQNVLEYARLGAPTREPVAVAPLLDGLLQDAAPELAERAVRVRRTGADEVSCVGDPAQLAYGLRNLLAGVLREVPARQEFAVDASRNGVVTLAFPAGDGTAARLRAMLDPDGRGALGDPTLLPLAFTLARAVLERNGGTLAVREDDDGRTTLVVRLPTTKTD